MDEPYVDFSSSIINFRVNPPEVRHGTPRHLPRFSNRGEILNFLSNITTATENSTIDELFDISDNIIWDSIPSDEILLEAGVNISNADVRTNHSTFSPETLSFLSDMSDIRRTVNTFRNLNNDISANLLHTPTASHSFLGSFGAGTQINSIMNRSLHDSMGYKNIISEEGTATLKNIKYSVEACNNDVCPITRATFAVDDEIVELPCGHCFNPEAIKRWLNDEKAECPVCRYVLKSKEIKKEYVPQMNVDEVQIRDARISLLNSLVNTNNTVHPFGPRLPPINQHRVSLIVNNEDNDELQEAIYRSLSTN